MKRSRLELLYRSGNVFVFTDGDGWLRFEQQKDRSTVRFVTGGATYARTWESNLNSRVFAEWAAKLTDLGFSENRFGYLAQTKFVDGSRTNLGSKDARITTVELVGQNLLWDGVEAVASIVEMADGKLAVQLEARGATLWLYGGGNFQINRTIDNVQTSVVGESRLASPISSAQVPDEYPAFYTRLKNLVLLKT